MFVVIEIRFKDNLCYIFDNSSLEVAQLLTTAALKTMFYNLNDCKLSVLLLNNCIKRLDVKKVCDLLSTKTT